MFSVWGKAKKRGKAGIALTADGIAYVGLNTDEQLPVLQSCGFTAASQAAVLIQLGALCKHESIQTYPLGVCLDSSRFKLSLIEAPSVEAEELMQALSWKVKDHIDYPMDELVLDYVDIPPTKSAAKMVYAVTSHESAIQQIVDQTGRDEGSLQRIDIPALALQTIVSRLPDAEEGIALLNLTQHDSLLTLGRSEKLYLSRGVDVRSSELRDGEANLDSSLAMPLFDNLLLDIQRSLDYYDSFFVDPPIRHLLVPTVDDSLNALIDYLDQNLTINIRRFTLDEIVTPGDELSIGQAHIGELMLALGVALWQTEPGS